jgi:hypothetical protein
MRSPTLGRGAVLFLLAATASAAVEPLSSEYKLGFTPREFQDRRLDAVRWDSPKDVAEEFGLGLAVRGKGDEATGYLARPGGEIMYGADFREFALAAMDEAPKRLKAALHGGVPAGLESDLRERGFYTARGLLSKDYVPTILLLRLARALDAREDEIDDAVEKIRVAPASGGGAETLLALVRTEMDTLAPGR